MHFKDMQYQRPDIAAISQNIEELAAAAVQAQSKEALLEVFSAYSALSDTVGTAGTLAAIRHTIDTTDEFYSKENDYFDENGPILQDKVLGLYRAILDSAYKAALAEKYGDILLEKMALAIQSSDERLIALQQKENALVTQYEMLYASARISFKGQELTIAQLAPYKQSTDRATRKEAMEAEGTFFDSHREELDRFYDELVKNRTQQAQLLGYQSYTPLGDIRMDRLGYSRENIASLRQGVLEHIVPYIAKLKQRQAQRIGVEKMAFYDDPLSFKDGNPTPKGTAGELLAAGQAMYRQLSKETSAFIDFMMERDLFDVLAKPGKAPGGYCTYIPQYHSPFIFSNFNGTSGDVDVLTHEAGHAFAAYIAAAQNLPAELMNPGLESCEIHSMSMEFFTSDYHHLFFGEDTKKYEISHTENALFFLPYGCQVDEFQETVYNNPALTPEERNALWMELERKYRPWNNFEDLPFYSRGAGWQRQIHIYERPFYFIDYVMAQTVALEFFLLKNKNAADAWQRYLALVSKAGTATYPQLVQAANLPIPYEKDALLSLGQEIYGWILDHSTNETTA